MKNTRSTKIIIVAAVFLIAGVTLAFAQGGWNNDGYGGRGYYGHMMGPGYGYGMMGQGYGYGMMGPGYGYGMMGPGYGYGMMGPGWAGPGSGHGYGRGYANLTEEQQAKIDAAREKFFNDTRELRRNIDERAYDLRQELNSKNPDAKKVAELQKDLSKAQAEFAQKAVQHRLEMRKLLPEGFQQGRGGYGYYGRGGGYCWGD